jgi:general secretion pathway protein K
MVRGSHDRGFALLLVLITLATLTLIVAASVDAARHYGEESFAKLRDVRIKAAVDGAVATVARDLAEAGAAPPAILSHAQTYNVGGIAVSVEVKSEAGRIDINAASPELIRALLVESGLKKERAVKLSDEIADWRDSDGDTRRGGAEASEYIAAGRSYVPTNRGFESVSELGLVLDGGENLADCLAPDITVFTRRGDVDPATASPRVLRATKMDAAASRPPSVSIVGGRVIDAGALFDIDLSATYREANRHLSAQTVVRITGSQTDPVWVLSRTSPAPRPADAAAACKRLNALD